MEDEIFGLVICGLWFALLIPEIVKGEIGLRSGVVRRRDNPFLFWLGAGLAVAWGLVVATFFFSDYLRWMVEAKSQVKWPM